MARVSLVLTAERAHGVADLGMSAACRALEAAGHEVEVLVASGPSSGLLNGTSASPGWRQVSVTTPGRAAAAVEGLLQATGDILLVVDPRANYEPADLVRVVEAVQAGHGELVLASRWSPDQTGGSRFAGARKRLGAVARFLTGSSDPLSGLVGLSREALGPAIGTFRAVGSNFALEFLAKVPGRRYDLPTEYRRTPGGIPTGLDELRHLKRLADHRFGDFSRLIQFCGVGASGMVIDLTCYAGLQHVLRATVLAHRVLPLVGKLDLAVARVLAVLIALTWNFTLNRRMTFSHARSGSILKQYIAYALSNALAILVNLSLGLWLPQRFAFFDQHKLGAAVVGIVLATAISFTMARWVVFRRGTEPARDETPSSDGLLANSSV